MSPLEVYEENGFKFFQCNSDKTPATPGFWPKDEARKKYNKVTGKEEQNFGWMEPENHLTIEAAEMLQSMGEMIGAWIPEDVIVIDLDRHPDKPDGVKSFKQVKEKYNIISNITEETFTVVTGGNGYHIFLYANKDHGFKQGCLKKDGEDIGIDVKTNSGYVIACGSPGYHLHPDVGDLDIMEMPESIRIWLEFENKKSEPKKEKPKQENKTFLPVSLLSKILTKLPIEEFDSNDKWFDLIVSAIATSGNGDDVIDVLSKWSAGDSRYNVDQAEKRIRSFDGNGGITPGTFVMILKEHNISQYFIKKVLSFSLSIELYVNMRDDGDALPFPEPDYDEISDSKEANELFLTAGNSVAATLLGFAIHQYIIYCDAEKKFYLFDGNRWSEFYDMFSITYTVLIRLCKFMFAKKRGTDVAGENFLKLVKAINKTHWKTDVLKELQCRDGVLYPTVDWDSHTLKETLTTQDSVIDFTNNHMIIRSGEREEFRKSCVPYNTDEIVNAGLPVKYNEFLASLFPDKDTLLTARQSSCMFISGNAKKVFQVYHGGGDNGKSTWIEIEKELLGPKAHTYSTSLILNSKYGDDKLPSEVTEFIGKYVLFGSEVEKGKKLSLGKLKNFTGQDTIGARPLYEKERTFAPTWQMILSVNDLPFFDGTDRAFIGRLLILPFEKTFVDCKEAKEDMIAKGNEGSLIDLIIDSDKLKTDIRAEFPAVINQKIKDYMDLKNNYKGIIHQSDKCRSHKESYISENNDIENFIVEMCVVGLNNGYFASSEELAEAYKDYSGLSKISSSFVTRGITKSRQEVLKYTKVVTETYHNNMDDNDYDKKIQRRGLKNIRLKTIDEMEQEENLNKEHSDGIPF